MENRAERFKRIATKRTVDIIDKIRILGNTSNKSTYEYTEADVTKIFKIKIYNKKNRVFSVRGKEDE